jgi:hypothetical protein
MPLQEIGPPKYIPRAGMVIFDSAVQLSGATEVCLMLRCLRDLNASYETVACLEYQYTVAFNGGNYDKCEDVRNDLISLVNEITYDLTAYTEGSLRFHTMISDDYGTTNWHKRWGWFTPSEWQWYGYKEVVGYYARKPRHAS